MTAAPSALFRYISRGFLMHFMVLVAILLSIVFIFDVIELMRRASTQDNIAFGTLLVMAGLKLPEVGQQMLPFGVLFGAIYTCWKLNRTQELVVIRAAGLSVWQFLSPMILSAVAIGVIATALVNPLSAFFLSRFDRMEIEYLKKESQLVTVSRTGIWLRQPVDSGYALLHADSFQQSQGRLGGVSVFFFDAQDTFQKRVDAAEAFLTPGFWEIPASLVNTRAGDKSTGNERLPTELTAQKIEDSFADPETISFWQIPEHARIMEETGFPATRLGLHFQSLLAKPLLFAAMILLAATFSLRPTRFGGTALMIGLGVATGFLIFFLESMLHAFGISQKIPVYLAAWTPALVSLLLGAAALLHLEDG